MTPDILAYLRHETAEPPAGISPFLLSVIDHWRDRLQTDDARAALTDDLALEACTADDLPIKGALFTWAETATAAWLAYCGAADIDALSDMAMAAMEADTLGGWAGAHDAMGACGVTTIAELVGGKSGRTACITAARLGRTVSTEVEGADGTKTTVTEHVGPDETVAALQGALRSVLAGLCAGG